MEYWIDGSTILLEEGDSFYFGASLLGDVEKGNKNGREMFMRTKRDIDFLLLRRFQCRADRQSSGRQAGSEKHG